MRRFSRVVGLALVASLVVVASAGADVADEQALAERYAPVVRLVEQLEECGPGEPYEPIDVGLVFDEPTVALRGPWNSVDLVKIAPTATDVAGLLEYHLDFPGNPLDAGCSYELWARQLTTGTQPAIYAHVATEPGRDRALALQYWFFYPFNDFNNTHEGDWEMIQLVFDAADAREALGKEPIAVGYSSHEGAEGARWKDEKLEVVDGTHPVVYPASGSHANKYTDALYLGSSAEAGVGCDDTRGPHREVSPRVIVLPSDRAAADAAFPWLTFEGRWGELQPAFFNGPTGPNLKTQWTHPIEWAEGWRDRSYAVPTGGLFGTGATDLFCGGVAVGSKAIAQLISNPVPLLVTLAVLAGVVLFVVIRATWTPVAPMRVARRRSWGQILSASGRMYVGRARLFLGIGLLLIPIVVAITLLQWLLFYGIDLVGTLTGTGAGAFAALALAIGTTLTLFGLTLVQAATACALVELDAGETVGVRHAYRAALRRAGPLLGATAILVVVWLALSATAFLIPVAIWLAIRWSLLACTCQLEGASSRGALRGSARLVSGRWLRTGSLVGISGAVALLAGPLLGALLIFATDAPLALLNLVAGGVYALAMPFVALVTAYVYFDARGRDALEAVERPDVLPAEYRLAD